MNKVVVCVAAGVVSSAVFASDWYVDANNGNDAWDVRCSRSLGIALAD